MYDGATASGVISLCAALSAQDTGGARQALNLLYKDGELARAAGESTITEFHVHEARDALEQSQIEHGMRELTRHGHLALVATLLLWVTSSLVPTLIAGACLLAALASARDRRGVRSEPTRSPDRWCPPARLRSTGRKIIVF